MPELTPELTVKRDALIELLKSYGSCAVAFSGGLDSTVLAKAAQLALGDRAVAVTGLSAALAASELEEAKSLAQLIGIRHELIETNELSDPQYQANNPDRCYHCKTELFTRVEELAERLDVAVVADGSNRDDHGDYRPGIACSRRQTSKKPLGRVRSDQSRNPHAGRTLAIAHLEQARRAMFEQPHCLRRSSHGRAAGDDRTGRRIFAQTRFQAASRALSPRRCRPDRSRAEAIQRFSEPHFRREVIEYFKSLGFKYISLDLEGFRSGSLNAVLPVESLAKSLIPNT